MKVDAAAPDDGVHGASDELGLLAARVAVLEDALAELRDQVAVMKAVELRRDAILDRYPLAQHASLARGVRIEAREFLTAGSGFYQLEEGANGIAYRWIGPNPEARLVVWVDRRFPLLLRFFCHNFGRSRFIRVKVEDQEFEIARQDKPQPIEVGPIRPRGQPGPTEICLAPEMMFSPEQQGHADKRTLGVTFVWLELQPSPEGAGTKPPASGVPTPEPRTP